MATALKQPERKQTAGDRPGAQAPSIEPFEYPSTPVPPELAVWAGYDGEEEEDIPEAAPEPAAPAPAVSQSELEQKMAEEARRSFEAGRERGREEGRLVERQAQAAAAKAAEEQRAHQAAGLIATFTQERDRYLRAVEREVVKLALAVAARILRREAQMDPLLLTGAVRVALGQLAGTTQAKLLVPAAELDLWKEAITLLPNLAVKPAVAAGEGMRLGDCVIETSLGSVDLGIRAQLNEIERGFFDRPGAAAATGATEAAR